MFFWEIILKYSLYRSHFRNHVGNIMEMILNPTSENNSGKVNKWIHFFLENNGDGVLLHVDLKVQPNTPDTGTFDHNLTH